MPFVLVRRSLVLRLPIVLLCERHRQRLRQRPVEWLSPLALGTHVISPKLDGKPHLRVTCSSPGHVENAATSFSRPTWDVVDHIHKDTTAYIDPLPLSRVVLQPCSFDSRYAGRVTRSVSISLVSPNTPLGKLQGLCSSEPHAQTVQYLFPIVSRHSADNNAWMELTV